MDGLEDESGFSSGESCKDDKDLKGNLVTHYECRTDNILNSSPASWFDAAYNQLATNETEKKKSQQKSV